jgi:hypothetical protein
MARAREGMRANAGYCWQRRMLHTDFLRNISYLTWKLRHRISSGYQIESSSMLDILLVSQFGSTFFFMNLTIGGR